jgi:hypothetical protein
MATGKVQIDEGATTNLATNTITEDAVTKHINRSILNNSSGTEIDTNSGNKSAATLRVVLATDQPALTNKLLVTPDLPSGASTSAKQDTGNTSLASIDGKITAVNTGAVVVASGSITADTELATAVAGGDSMSNPTTAPVHAHQAGWNTTAWERLRSGLGDGIAVTGLQNILGMLYNGSTYDRMRGDTTNGLDVDVTRVIPGTTATALGKAEDAAHSSGDTGVMALGVGNVAQSSFAADGDYIPLATDLKGNNMVVGNIAHDGVDAGNPVKVGGKAVAHSSNPTAVAAADRTDWIFNRHGIPFMIGGHPNVITIEAAYTAAQTDTALVTISTGSKIVVTQVQVIADAANTVKPQARVGFGTANTPTTTGVVLTHPGIPAGGGVSRGNGSGIIGIGADNEDLRVTCAVPTTGSLRVIATYYTIES